MGGKTCFIFTSATQGNAFDLGATNEGGVQTVILDTCYAGTVGTGKAGYRLWSEPLHSLTVQELTGLSLLVIP